jgi:hypothetical protein
VLKDKQEEQVIQGHKELEVQLVHRVTLVFLVHRVLKATSDQ